MRKSCGGLGQVTECIPWSPKRRYARFSANILALGLKYKARVTYSVSSLTGLESLIRWLATAFVG